MRIAIIADDLQEIRGGIEYHASVLQTKLSDRGHLVSLVGYNGFIADAGKLKEKDLVILEGVRRYYLLWTFFFRREVLHKCLLFTHGSFMYLTYRKKLRKFGYYDIRTPMLLLFDNLFLNMIFKSIKGVVTLGLKEKEDLAAYFKIDPTKLSVLDIFMQKDWIQPIHDPNEAGINKFMSKVEKLKPYVCTISRLEIRKNLISAILATHLAGINYILAGKDQGLLKDINKAIGKNNINNFSYIGEVTNEEKEELIQNSVGVLLPSFLEGIPRLAYETLALKRPILLTKYSYMPHYQGIYECEPTVNSIADGINIMKESCDKIGDLKGEIALKSDEEIVQEFCKLFNVQNS